jgi:hypothetical protein
MGFNSRTGLIEIDWTRSKTASSGRYNIFVDSMHFERDFLHALVSFFVIHLLNCFQTVQNHLLLFCICE